MEEKPAKEDVTDKSQNLDAVMDTTGANTDDVDIFRYSDRSLRAKTATTVDGVTI